MRSNVTRRNSVALSASGAGVRRFASSWARRNVSIGERAQVRFFTPGVAEWWIG